MLVVQQSRRFRDTYARSRRDFVVGALSKVEAREVIKEVGHSEAVSELALLEWVRLRDSQRRREGKSTD